MTEIDELGGWGSYTIPQDNPYRGINGSRQEIWALGFRNPWRCSFDSERPRYFFCGDVGQVNFLHNSKQLLPKTLTLKFIQNSYEEVNLVTKRGNYGWGVCEGPNLYNSSSSPGGNTSACSITTIPPVMGYSHGELNVNTQSAAITAGYVYRSLTDPCLYGR